MSRTVRTFQVSDWLRFRREQIPPNKTLGFVPTMGALHAGHISLVDRSKAENDITLVSIFVNPTQFNDPKDLQRYPRTLEKDLDLLEKARADYLLLPEYDELYRDRYAYKVIETQFSKLLCGKTRPGHFEGVLTVVMKLLNIAAANRAYFGEKDFQQLSLISDMRESFFMPTEIIACPTIRERDGLAMSSRNAVLSREDRQRAPLIFELLSSKQSCNEIRRQLESRGFAIDYLEEMAGRRFIAASLGNVRLIDNVKIP